MSAQILDGKALARQTRQELRARAEALKARGVTPRLDVIVAATDPASLAYVRMKRKWAGEIGIEGQAYEVTDATPTDEVLSLVDRLNADPSVHGVLIQHPLPKGIDEDRCLARLDPDKDVDGITSASLGRLAAGQPGFRCATPLGIMRLLAHAGIALEGLRALVIGRSVILGKPAALLLLEANATVTIAHSRSRDLPALCAQADLVVAAVGKPEMIRGEWLKRGAIVVDAGYNKVEGRSGDVGDVHFESAVQVASWITPVPGGVGPMTVATLLANCLDAAERAREVAPPS